MMKIFILIILLHANTLIHAGTTDTIDWIGGWKIGDKKSVEEINKRACVGNNRYRCVPIPIEPQVGG